MIKDFLQRFGTVNINFTRYKLMETYFDILYWLVDNPALSVPVLFVQYAAAMTIHHKADNKIVSAVVGAWFIPQDFIVNLVAFSFIGMERPHEWLVTHRLNRWLTSTDTDLLARYRFQVADKICILLHKFDSGHCI